MSLSQSFHFVEEPRFKVIKAAPTAELNVILHKMQATYDTFLVCRHYLGSVHKNELIEAILHANGNKTNEIAAWIARIFIDYLKLTPLAESEVTETYFPRLLPQLTKKYGEQTGYASTNTAPLSRVSTGTTDHGDSYEKQAHITPLAREERTADHTPAPSAPPPPPPSTHAPSSSSSGNDGGGGFFRGVANFLTPSFAVRAPTLPDDVTAVKTDQQHGTQGRMSRRGDSPRPRSAVNINIPLDNEREKECMKELTRIATSVKSKGDSASKRYNRIRAQLGLIQLVEQRGGRLSSELLESFAA